MKFKMCCDTGSKLCCFPLNTFSAKQIPIAVIEKAGSSLLHDLKTIYWNLGCSQKGDIIQDTKTRQTPPLLLQTRPIHLDIQQTICFCLQCQPPLFHLPIVINHSSAEQFIQTLETERHCGNLTLLSAFLYRWKWKVTRNLKIVFLIVETKKKKHLHISHLAAVEHLSHGVYSSVEVSLVELKHPSKPNMKHTHCTSSTAFCGDVCWYSSSALAVLCQPQSCLLTSCFSILEPTALLLPPLRLPPRTLWQFSLKTSHKVSLIYTAKLPHLYESSHQACLSKLNLQ